MLKQFEDESVFGPDADNGEATKATVPLRKRMQGDSYCISMRTKADLRKALLAAAYAINPNDVGVVSDGWVLDHVMYFEWITKKAATKKGY